MTAQTLADGIVPADFARLLSARRMQDLCDLAKPLRPGALTPDMARMLVIAALAAGDDAARALAVAAGMELRLAPAVRSVMVQRLMRAGHDDDAVALLLADPGFHHPPPTARQTVVDAYAAVAQHGRSAGVRQAASAAVRSLLNRALMVASPSPLQLPRAALSAESLAPRPLRLIPAGPAEEADASLFRAQAEAFEAELRRPLPEEAMVVHDVYVSRTGEYWNAEGQVLRGPRRPLRPECLAAMDGAPVIEEAVCALDWTGNFYHWMTETLPSIAFAAVPGAPALPVLVRDDAPRFAVSSLELASPALAARVRRVGDAAFVRRLHFGPRNTANLRFWGSYEHLLNPLIAQADVLPPSQDDGDLLYISRRDSPLRPMLNEAELEAALAGLGFRSVVLSALSLLEQIRTVRRAKVVVAQHGAGLAHLLFARPGTRVLELQNVRDGDHPLIFCMARLSRLRGHGHAMWIQRAPVLEPAWTVQTPGVLAAVRDMLG